MFLVSCNTLLYNVLQQPWEDALRACGEGRAGIIHGNSVFWLLYLLPLLEREREPVTCLLYYFYLAVLPPGSQSTLQTASSASEHSFPSPLNAVTSPNAF